MSSRTKWFNRFVKRSAVVLAAASASAGLVDSAFAQANGTYTFNGDGNWSNTARWLDGIVPDGAGGNAAFGSNVIGIGVSGNTLAVTLDSNRTVGSLTFSDADTSTPAGWVLVGSSTLRIDPELGDSATITVNALGNNTAAPGHLGQRIAQITAPLSGSQGFTKGGGGTLVLDGNSSGLSGTVTLDQGALMLGHANALGTSGTLVQRNGNLGLRTETGANFNLNIEMRNEMVIGTGNAIDASTGANSGAYGNGVNQTQTIGSVTITGIGHRGLTISGSNGYGLTMGTLSILDGLTLRNQGDDNVITNTTTGDDINRHSNNKNGLGSGLVTIDRVRYTGSGAGVLDLTGTGAFAGNITITNGISETGGGTVSLNVSNDKTVTIGGALGHTGTTAVRGNGTTIVSTSALTNSQALILDGGTLQFNGSSLSHTVGNLSMGGGTIAAGNVISYLGLGSGGQISTTGSINVSSSVLTDGTTTNTIATINGKLNNGAGDKTINVQGGGDSLTVTGDVSGTGGIIKTGKGSLNLTSATSFTGTNLTIRDGTLAGTAVAGSGTPFGSSSVNVTAGGQIRLNGIGSAQTESVSTYTASDSGQNSGIAVDGTAGNTTLSISTWSNRATGERSTVLVVPVSGSLGTNEHVVFGAGPATTNGMLDAYWAVQNSGSDTQLRFATISGGGQIGLLSEGTTNLASSVNTDTVNTGTVSLGGNAAAYAVRVDSGQTVNVNGNTLSVGTGGFGGVILNGGASIAGGSLTAASGGELNLWSGGTTANTITSQVVLGGDLTTGGATTLRMQGTVNFNGGSRNITTTGNAATVINAALSNGTGLTKRGGGTLILSGTNTGFAGPITVQNGILQVGESGTTGDLSNVAITNNATLMFKRSDAATFTNSISGSGDLVQDGAGSTITLSSTGLTYTGKTIARNGTLRPVFETVRPSGQTVFFPSTSDLVVERNGTFDLNGQDATFNSVNGTGLITSSNVFAAGTPTSLTISSGSFGGGIRQTGSNNNQITLNKVSSGELILSGNSSFRGQIRVVGGSLRVDTMESVSSLAQGTAIVTNPTITLAGGTLKLNIPTQTNAPANLTPNLNVLINPLVFPAGTTGTISLLSRNGQVTGTVSDTSGVGIAGGTNTISGTGTMVLDIRGRQLEWGQNATGFDGPIMMSFAGTVRFLDSNPVGSVMRFGNYVNATRPGFTGETISTSGSGLATFAFGNGNLYVKSRNGSQTVNMGFVSGGTNTVLSGYENTPFRTTMYQLGQLPGQQTFNGTMVDEIQRGQFGPTAMIKVGSSSNLTLTNTLSYTAQTTVLQGTLTLGAGSRIAGSPTIAVGGNGNFGLNGPPTAGLSTLAFAGGTFNTLQNFINLASASGALNVTAVPGYATLPLLTYLGNGTVYGNVNHNAGSTNPGIIGTAGTLTFANGLSISQNGNFTFDVNPGVGLNVVMGGGTNDLLRVPTVNGLRIDGGVMRLNFIGGITSLSVGQVFPLLSYAGTIQGGGLGAIQAFATFPGSFNLTLGSGSLANVIEATVANLSIPTINLTWAPPTSDKSWDAATIRNFKPTGGAGSQFYFNGDTVLFDDTADAAHHTVILGASDLQPLSVTVTTNSQYVWLGAGSMVSGSLVKNGSGTLTIANVNGNSFAGGVIVNGGFLEADRQAGGTPAPGSPWTPWGNGTITLNNDAALVFTAKIGNNTQSPVYRGLIINGDNKVFVPGNAAPQSIIPANPANTGLGNVFGSGTLEIIRPTGDTSANMDINANMVSFLGTLKYNDNIIAGTMRWQTSMRGGPSITFDLGAGSTTIGAQAGLSQMGQLMGGVNSRINIPAAGNLNIGEKNLSSTFDGQVTGAAGGAITKFGSQATLTLTSTHGYTGQTLVNEGTLALVSDTNSPLGNSPTITIATGAVLDVSGLNGGAGGITVLANRTLRSNGTVVGGTVTAGPGGTAGGTTYGANSSIDVLTDGTLAPGNSVGTLTTGTLSLHNNSNLLMEAGAGAIDSINVTIPDGLDLEIGAAINVNMVNLGGVVPGSYVFIDYAITGGDDDPTANGGWENFFVFNPAFPFNVNLTRDDANTRLVLNIADNSGKWFKNNGSDAWGTAANWTSDYINTASQVPSSVEFGTFITAAQTVTIGPSQVANNVIFNSPNSYTITGTGTLTLDSGGVSGVSVLQGNHTIRPAVRLLHDVQVSVAASSNITFAGTIINANNAQLTKVGNGSATFTQLNMNTGSFTVNAGTATLTQKASVNAPTGTSIVRNLSIATGAKLNLTNNDFIIDTAANPSGAQLTVVRQELQDGRLFSNLANSTQALGYRTNVAVASPTLLGVATATATFGGVTVDASSILIRLTLKGDSNLDGDVDIEDLYNLANNFLSTTATWLQGDFNYDGTTNAMDLSLLATNWQQTFSGGEILSSMTLEEALTAIGGLGNPSVPEPSTLAMAGVAATGLLGRRRRRRS